jgi:hypothetical protein
MNGETSSPRERPGLRLRAFLPLSEDSPFGTRGQKLPALIQSFGTPPLARRASTFRFLEGQEDLEAARRLAENDSHDPEERDGAGDRRMSNAVHILMTPEMRSQRLIGNSNPRYKWCVVSAEEREKIVANTESGSDISRPTQS